MIEYKPIRKTAFMFYKNCPKQFWYFYNDEIAYKGYKEASRDQALVYGTAFHLAADEFFKHVVLEPCDKPLDDGVNPFRKYLPINTPIDKWYDWFADYEYKRYEKLWKDGNAEYYKPIATELFVQMPDVIDRSGHIDRIDVIPGTQNLQIVEYKTGRSYNMDKEQVVTKMNAEIGFYVQILNSIKQFPTYKITEWKVINPTLEKSWVNTISPITLRSVDQAYNALIQEVFNKGPFERNVTLLCRYCPYVSDCLYSNDYEKIVVD